METQTQQSKGKKVLIETWGCQMNVADSENMLNMLKDEDYTVTDKAEDADLVLLNTCHIREKATHKVLSRLGRLREISKEQNPSMKIAVAGCVAQAEGKKLMDQAETSMFSSALVRLMSFLRFWTSIRKQERKPLPLASATRKQKKRSRIMYRVIEAKPTMSGKSEISRFINIAQGCNNFCTFCVVPFTRGHEISRTIDEIAEEAKNLIDQGAQEITLLGQNVNSYGLDLVDDGRMSVSDRGPL